MGWDGKEVRFETGVGKGSTLLNVEETTEQVGDGGGVGRTNRILLLHRLRPFPLGPFLFALLHARRTTLETSKRRRIHIPLLSNFSSHASPFHFLPPHRIRPGPISIKYPNPRDVFIVFLVFFFNKKNHPLTIPTSQILRICKTYSQIVLYKKYTRNLHVETWPTVVLSSCVKKPYHIQFFFNIILLHKIFLTEQHITYN